MGLGPSLCTRCRVFHTYIPNAIPNRQGDWVCPINNNHTERAGLFELAEEEWGDIFIESSWVRSVEKE